MTLLEQDSLVDRLYSNMWGIGDLDLSSEMPGYIRRLLNDRKKPRAILIKGRALRSVNRARRGYNKVRVCNHTFRFGQHHDFDSLEAEVSVDENVLDIWIDGSNYHESIVFGNQISFSGNLRMDRVEEAFLRRRVNWAGEISVFGIRYGVGRAYSDNDVFVYFKMDSQKKSGNLYLFNSDGEFIMPVDF